MNIEEIIRELVKLANVYDSKGEFEISNILDKVAASLAKRNIVAKRLTYRERKEVPCIFPARHPKVKPEPGRKSKRGHFPIPDLAHARNAIQRVEAYDKAPAWWDGTLEELKQIVYREVYKKFPGLKKRKEEREKGVKKSFVEKKTELKPGDMVRFEKYREMGRGRGVYYSTGVAEIIEYDPIDDVYYVKAEFDSGVYNPKTTLEPADIIARYCPVHGESYPLHEDICPYCSGKEEIE